MYGQSGDVTNRNDMFGDLEPDFSKEMPILAAWSRVLSPDSPHLKGCSGNKSEEMRIQQDCDTP